LRRGEIWWAELPSPAGSRPVLLVSRDEAYDIRAFVMVAPVTTTIRRIPSEVPVGPPQGLPRASVANLDSLATVPKATFRRRIGVLDAEKMEAVERALHFSLGLET
jgi:mRNA interferase MazF